MPRMIMDELKISAILLIPISLNALLFQQKLPSLAHLLVALKGGGIGFPHPTPQRRADANIAEKPNATAIIPTQPVNLLIFKLFTKTKSVCFKLYDLWKTETLIMKNGCLDRSLVVLVPNAQKKNARALLYGLFPSNLDKLIFHKTLSTRTLFR